MSRWIVTILLLGAMNFPTMAQTFGGHGLLHALHQSVQDHQRTNHGHDTAHSHDDLAFADTEPPHHVLSDQHHQQSFFTLAETPRKKWSAFERDDDQPQLTDLLAYAHGRDFSPDPTATGVPCSTASLPYFSQRDTWLRTQRLRI